MANSTSKVGSEGVGRFEEFVIPPSKLKTYGFALAIIVGIGGLGLGAARFAGLHIGGLQNISQLNAIIAMGGGVIFLGVGIIGTVKNRQVQREVYGAEIWPELGRRWGRKLEVLDEQIPKEPAGALGEGQKRIYIPKKIRVDGKEKDFTLNTLIEIRGVQFINYDPTVQDQVGDNTASGWIEVDKSTIFTSFNHEERQAQKKKITNQSDLSLPSVLEAVVLNLIFIAFSGKSWADTCCSEAIGSQEDRVDVFITPVDGSISIISKPKDDLPFDWAWVRWKF